MTLVCAWVRKTEGTLEELIVASDSRLRGGMTWDHGQKVFPLGRGDSVLAFAGDTFYAYPLILQTMRYLEDYEQATNRSLPLEELKGHLERLLTDLLIRVYDLPKGSKGEELDLNGGFTLLLAGYSVTVNDWRIWISDVDSRSRQLQFKRARRVKGLGGVVFVGSGGSAAATRLRADRVAIWKSRKNPPPINWEPIDILDEIIASRMDVSVGGPIQLVKVYSHLNVMPYAVFWPNKASGKVTLFGRPLLDYETTQRLAFDPKTHDVFKLWDYLQVPTQAKKDRKKQT